MSSPQELRERTKSFAIRIVKLFRALPLTPDAQIIGKQLLRSGTSVGANYRAACRARSRSEFISKLGVVVEEADEAMFWLDLLGETGIVPMQRLEEISREARELTAIFTAARATSKAN
jgi:four helix bundle protein